MAGSMDRYNKRRAASTAAWAKGDVFIDASEINQLAIDLGEAAAEIAPRVSQVVRKSALRVEAEAKAFTPVDTGYLRNSISGEMDGDGLGATIGPAASYGAFVELGTSRTGPRAFMGPAFDRAQPDFLAALEQIVGDAL